MAVLRQFHPAFVAAAAEARAAELPPRRTLPHAAVILDPDILRGIEPDLSAAVPELAGDAHLFSEIGCGCEGHRVYSFPIGVEFSGEPFSARSQSKSRANPRFSVKGQKNGRDPSFSEPRPRKNETADRAVKDLRR